MSKFLRELMEQPQALERLLGEKREIEKSISHVKPRRMLFAGMGASYYAGMYATMYLLDNGMDAQCIELSQILNYNSPLYLNKFDAIILISQSGESIELEKFVERYEHLLKKVFFVTNNPMCRTGKFLSEGRVIGINAGEEEAMGSTKTFVNTIAALMIISSKWLDKELDFSNFPKAFEVALQQSVTSVLSRFERAGTSVLISWKYGVPLMEMARLTLIEVAKHPCLVYEGAMFRHGPIEIMITNPLIILLSIEDATTECKCSSLCKRLKTLGFAPVLLGRKRPSNIYIDVPLPSELTPIPYIVIFQKLAHSLAEIEGYDPGTGIFSAKITREE
ncbi:MAG: SIS domain-containing protein [Candidatus Marinimicrobia bacterium]|nr:SIS domain-containing protein [Candidatus Neomarinimicrobiota bacterium]